jgi:predicted nucleic acid-binding protein
MRTTSGCDGEDLLDTNVLLYAEDADTGEKRVRAQEIVAGAIATALESSTQVLQEYFVVSTRKLGLAAEIAQRKVELLAALPVVTLEVSHVLEAIKLHRLYQLSFWDALTLHAAKTAGCGRLMTEDLQDGQIVEGVQIVNPFRLSP